MHSFLLWVLPSFLQDEFSADTITYKPEVLLLLIRKNSHWSSIHTPPPGFNLMNVVTPQIDGSTLRTICMQHGPLLTFHLNLTQGTALIRYNTKQEAAKAQTALHMWVPIVRSLRQTRVKKHTWVFCRLLDETHMHKSMHRNGIMA